MLRIASAVSVRLCPGAAESVAYAAEELTYKKKYKQKYFFIKRKFVLGKK